MIFVCLKVTNLGVSGQRPFAAQNAAGRPSKIGLKDAHAEVILSRQYPPFRKYYAINPSEIISRNDYANFVQSSQK